MENLKEIIKEERKRMHLSQEELGDKIGVSQKAISKYEVGKATPPPDVLKKMADVFGVSLDYLFGRTEEVKIEHKDDHFIFYFPVEGPPLADVAQRRGITIEILSEKTRIDVDCLKNCYEKYTPTYTELSAIATALNTSTDFLLGRTEEIDPPNTEEQALLRYFRGLSELDQHLLLGKAAGMMKNKNAERSGRSSCENGKIIPFVWYRRV